MFFAEADPVSIPNLLTNLGSAGAVVVVVGYFLAHLKSETGKYQDLFKQAQAAFQESLCEVNERHESAVRSVEDKFQRVFDQQAAAINTVALAIKDTETATRINTSILEHLERTIHSLHGFLERDKRYAPVVRTASEPPKPE